MVLSFSVCVCGYRDSPSRAGHSESGRWQPATVPPPSLRAAPKCHQWPRLRLRLGGPPCWRA
eukprot:1921321-Rhodomonas_salina.1